ncbi:MAG: HNH endonuclease [Clostridia bacterium]|nr:HNH endonuclease [Clostridia bacterium]
MDLQELYVAERKYKNAKKVNIILLILSSIICIVDLVFIENKIAFNIISSVLAAFVIAYIVTLIIRHSKYNSLYSKLQNSVLKSLNLSGWIRFDHFDYSVSVKSRKAVSTYDEIKLFQEREYLLPRSIEIVRNKREYASLLREFLNNNEFKGITTYKKIEQQVLYCLQNTDPVYNVRVQYTSPAGRSQLSSRLCIREGRLIELNKDKSLLMSKSEYNKYCREQEAQRLEDIQHNYYERVNDIIDYSNDNKSILVSENDINELDKCVTELIKRTIHNIKKVKSSDSEEWDILDKIIEQSNDEITRIIDNRKIILDYYRSYEFKEIKETCESLMSKQREFNGYIDEKAKAISILFGTNITRNSTLHEDVYNYVHPYQKSISPFTAEVSSSVFASAENSPLEYVIKYFYPDKTIYPKQIQKLHLLVEELETLKEAKQIIDKQKDEIQQYIENVPDFVMENDADGFYSRLGFAIINENVLNVEYKFSYTSNGGKAQRTFTIPMTEDLIVRLIKALESKLTVSSFSKEQRLLMTSKLRQKIKERDNYTCRYCGNSTKKEPNLLLEIDHIIPVTKGGFTEESNLQTLCWKCNRKKGDKII